MSRTNQSLPITGAWPDVVAGTMHMAGWGLDAVQRLRWIETCADMGIDTFDHADIYGGYTVEGLFGEALALAPGLRNRLRLITKCGIRLISANRPAHRLKSYDASASHIEASVDASLKALRTDRIDLLLLHRPDPLMDPDEVAGAVQRLTTTGKVLTFGVSNFSPSQFALLDAATPLATNQIEFHPLHRDPLEDGTLDQALRLGRRPMIWSPLAGGRLLRPVEDHASSDARVQWVVGEVSARLGVSPATVLYAWCKRHPSRPIVVTGSRRIDALHDALAGTSLRLSREDWTAIWQAATGREPA